MAGTYTHITLIHHACTRASGSINDRRVLYALRSNLRYAELGSISLDYPYLVPMQKHWADSMHYDNTAAVVVAGVQAIRSCREDERDVASAWFLGYLAHMVTDMTIHPVIELLVGEYSKNKRRHRICEMHQDAFVFSGLNVGNANVTEHLRLGVGSCGENGCPGVLDPVVSRVWLKMLEAACPDGFRLTPPMPRMWHKSFIGILSSINVASRKKLVPFGRHTSAFMGLTYPSFSEINGYYLKSLPTPLGKTWDFQEVFELAVNNVLKFWAAIMHPDAKRVDDFVGRLEDWNLDTGISSPSNRIIFWEEVA